MIRRGALGHAPLYRPGKTRAKNSRRIGIIWIRTRNLLLLALIHTAGDLLPNLAETIRLLRLGA